MEDLKGLYKFIETMSSVSGHVSNVYVAKTYTFDGVLTDTKYGMNLLTDYGFSLFFANDSNVNFPTKLYVGEGTQSFDKTSNTMTAVLFNGLAATTSNTTVSHEYPMFYAPGETDTDGRVTTVSRYMVCYFPSNITDVSANVTITEYGIGTNWNELWTHSFVYDNQGQRTSLIKKPNEILEITVYLCCSFLESLIMDNFAANTFSIITTGHLMMNRMKIPTVGTYKRVNHSNQNGYKSRTVSTYSRSAIVDSTVTKSALMETILVTQNDTEYEKYIDGFYASTTGMLIAQPQRLTNPISFEIGPFWSYNPENDYGFSERFGVEYPFTQLVVTDVKMFNPFVGTSGEWNNTGVYYYNDPRHEYDETLMTVGLRTVMYYTNGENVETLYIFLNPNISDPIVKIRGNIEMVYATDKYWKGPNIPNNDWIRIDDHDNIPLAAQNKRFWVTNSSSVNIEPLRGFKDFHLKLTEDAADSGYMTTPNKFVTDSGFSKPTCSIFNTTYHWSYAWGGQDNSYYNNRSEIFGFDVNFHQDMSTTNIKYAATYGKWLFVVDSTPRRSVWDTSTIPNGTLASPTRTNYSSGVVFATETTVGIVFSSQPSRSEGIIHDLRVDPIVETNFPCKCGCCMYGVNKIAYVTTDGSELRIYDIDNSRDESSLPLSSLSGTARTIFAHRNHVWISTTDSKTYVCNLTAATFTECDRNVDFYSTAGIYLKCFDNIVTLGHVEGGNAWFIGINVNDDPSHLAFVNSTTFNLDGYNDGNLGIMPYRIGNSILGIVGGISTHWSSNGRPNLKYFDVGRMICTGDTSYIQGVDQYGMEFVYDKWFVHGEKMIPMMNMLPIKLQGTTTTITSINNTERSVSGKKFEITYSNKTIFNGKPPGTSN